MFNIWHINTSTDFINPPLIFSCLSEAGLQRVEDGGGWHWARSGYTLYNSPVHHRANIQRQITLSCSHSTHAENLESPINLHVFRLGEKVSVSQENPRRHGGTAHRKATFKTRNFLLWGKVLITVPSHRFISTNSCDKMLASMSRFFSPEDCMGWLPSCR